MGAETVPDQQDERQCRYCLSEGTEPGNELISPCACRGDQKWVHEECLKRWQRSVLVTQPTHPAFYESDERQTVCNVCREEFNPPPPTRAELMLGFTGPEIASLLDVGCLIVTERETSQQMASMAHAHAIFAISLSLPHWINGVYLITHIEQREEDTGEDGIVAVNLARKCRRVPATLSDYVTSVLRDIRAGRLENGSESDENNEPEPPQGSEGEVHSTTQGGEETPATQEIEVNVSHYIGGPCETDVGIGIAQLHSTPLSSLSDLNVSVCGNQGGLWVSGLFRYVANAARLDAVRAGRPACHVRVHWGTAQWSRTQLLGEIARGSWGMCRATASDVFAQGTPRDEGLWEEIEGSTRLIYAPRSEMTEAQGVSSREMREAPAEDTEDMREQMARHREELRRRVLQQMERERERQRDASRELPQNRDSHDENSGTQ